MAGNSFVGSEVDFVAAQIFCCAVIPIETSWAVPAKILDSLRLKFVFVCRKLYRRFVTNSLSEMLQLR